MDIKANGSRIWELDFLRGTALILMIYFHIIFDMAVFFNYSVSYEGNINYYIGKISAILFILIAGICCSLSGNNIKRGLKVTGAALFVTLASYIYNPGFIILFGILHFLGFCILLSTATNKLGKYSLLISGTIIIITGFFIQFINVNHNYLFIFGIINRSFVSQDFYPLIPWFGVFLYGMAFGKELYSQNRSLFKSSPRYRMVSTAGRHTLPIYLIHQPVILLIFKLAALIW